MNKEKLSDFIKRCLPYLACAVAIIAIIGTICMGVNKVQKEMMTTTEAWRTDMAKSIAMLSSKVSSMEKGLEDLEKKFNDSPVNVTFEVEEYPVKYAFTEKSEEELKNFVLTEMLPAMKTAYEMSDEEYESMLASTATLTAEQIMSSYEMDSVALGIELVNETIARIGGIDGIYNVDEGKMYADGYYFGDISDEKICYNQNANGIPLVINFYREGGDAKEMNITEKIDVIESRIRSILSGNTQTTQHLEHYSAELNEFNTIADGLRVDLNAVTNEISELKENFEKASGEVEAMNNAASESDKKYDEVMALAAKFDERLTEAENSVNEIIEYGQYVAQFIDEAPDYVQQGFEELVAMIQELGTLVVGIEDRVEDLEIVRDALEDNIESVQDFFQQVYNVSEQIEQVVAEIDSTHTKLESRVQALENFATEVAGF